MLEDILKNYECKVITDDVLLNKYVFRNSQGDYLEIFQFLSDKREIRFVHDNFPGQRRFFSTNIPYSSVNDFESDLNRMGIELPKKLKK